MPTLSSDLAERRVSAQLALSEALARSRGRESLPRILEVIAQGLEAQVTELWLEDCAARVLRCEAIWIAPGLDGGAFAKVARSTTFAHGRGLPGRAWAAGVPEWTTDALADTEFARKNSARELGLHAAVAFPVESAGGAAGVIQSFFGRVMEPDPKLLELFADVGSQVGFYLERTRLGEALVQQAREILEVSTPVLPIWDGVLFAPLVGSLDSARARQLEERVLVAITETQSPVLLVDVTGVPVIDTDTAQRLLQTVRAVGLLGAKVVLTGLSPHVATTLVGLGVKLGDVETFGTLAAGLRRAMATVQARPR